MKHSTEQSTEHTQNKDNTLNRNEKKITMQNTEYQSKKSTAWNNLD